jgi:streptogramin lyase
VLATGGDAGSGSNSAIAMMSLAGPCNSLSSSTFVTVNELTTAAAEWTLAPFVDSTGAVIGVSSGNAAGLNNAVNASETNLVVSYMASGGNSSNTGVPAAFLSSLGCPTPPTDAQPANCDALDRLDTLANILASCIDSSGPTSTQCSTLFSSTSSSTTTLQAAHAIVTNPTANVAAIYGITPPAGLTQFAPNLTAAPADFTLALNFAPTGSNFSQPLGMALDNAGNVWVTNYSGNTVTELNPAGALVDNFAPTGANFSAPRGIALDGSGNVWVGNQGNDSVTELNSSGALVGNILAPTGADFNAPLSVALDSLGNLFVANCGTFCTGTGDTGSVSELLAGCSVSSCTANNFAPAGAAFNDPIALVLNSAGDVWAANNDPNAPTSASVSELTAASNYATGINFTPANANFNGPYGVALDNAGNVWVTNSDGNSITELDSSGALVDNFAPANALSQPRGVALDSAGNVWVANFGSSGAAANSLTELSSTGTVIGTFAPAGASLDGAYGVAVDNAGDVWVTNSTGNSVSELVGSAKPVLTPIQACLQNDQNVCVP